MDEEEYYEEEPDFEEDFESQFQDELDMMTEMQEPPARTIPTISKSKRKIKFLSPPEVSRYTLSLLEISVIALPRKGVCLLQGTSKAKKYFDIIIIIIISVVFIIRS